MCEVAADDFHHPMEQSSCTNQCQVFCRPVHHLLDFKKKNVNRWSGHSYVDLFVICWIFQKVFKGMEQPVLCQCSVIASYDMHDRLQCIYSVLLLWALVTHKCVGQLTLKFLKYLRHGH